MALAAHQRTVLRLVCWHTDKDESFLKALETRLAVLEREGLITIWSGLHIRAGSDWKNEIEKHLNVAHIILLCISPDFLASDIYSTTQFQQIMEKHVAGKVRVIPLILRPVDWTQTPFKHLSPLPTKGNPISKWRNPDEGWLDIIKGLRAVIEDISASSFIHDHEMLPSNPAVFIGRAYEQREFQTSLDALVTEEPNTSIQPVAQVFLVQGEGGWGKSTLLGQYIRKCQEQEKRLFWVYIDWEKLGTDIHQGTPTMMEHIVELLESKYQLFCPHFKEIIERRGQISVKVDTFRTQFDSRGAFEDFLQIHLSSDDYRLYKRSQPELSKALVSDLLAIAQMRPFVFLFDTWEVVMQYADEWLRRGLLQHTLTHHDLGKRFLFVVAGRLISDMKYSFTDDVRRYTHELGLYSIELSRFTQDDIIHYFQKHPRIGYSLSEEEAKMIREVTYGIPLAISTLGSMIPTVEDIHQFLLEVKTVDSQQQKIVDQMLVRFFRHLDKQPKQVAERDRDCIYTFALMRRHEESDDLPRRTSFLQELWIAINIVQNEYEFWTMLDDVRSRYSFLFDGGSMHVDVYNFIRTTLAKQSRIVFICKHAAFLCSTHLDQRAQDIKHKLGEERLESERYKDLLWQEWLFDSISYRLWLDDDDVIESVVNHFFLGRLYGTNVFHRRLLKIIRDDAHDRVIYDHLRSDHKIIIDQLNSLQEWFGQAQMAMEREYLLKMLRGAAHFEGVLHAAEATILVNDFKTARAYLAQAENLYYGLESRERTPQLKKRLARVFSLLSTMMDQSSLKSLRGLVLPAIEKACRLDVDNPYLRCSLAEAFMNVKRFEEAEVECEAAISFSRGDEYKAASEWAHKLQARLEQRAISERQSPQKHAHVITCRANALSTYGAFQEAEKLYRLAMRVAPTYCSSFVKLSHLLCRLYRMKDAQQVLARLEIDEIADTRLKATMHDAYGALFLVSGELEKARDHYQMAISLSPGYVNAHYGIGKVFLRLGETKEALKAFEEAIWLKRQSLNGASIKASFFWVWNEIGIAFLLTDNVDSALKAFATAEMLIHRSLERNVQARRYQIWSHLGLAYLGQNKDKEAKEAYQNFIQTKQIQQAQGYIQEALVEVDLLGTSTNVHGWQEIYAFLESHMKY